jgi:activator of 2-hydroxyglutaryl-CoA dehydratase
MAVRTVLGMDNGGTTTKVAIVSANGEVLAAASHTAIRKVISVALARMGMNIGI